MRKRIAVGLQVRKIYLYTNLSRARLEETLDTSRIGPRINHKLRLLFFNDLVVCFSSTQNRRAADIFRDISGCFQSIAADLR